MLRITRSCLFLYTCLATASIGSVASADQVLYQCPDLANAQKRTMAEMTQGMNGWFFRISGDLKEDYDLMPEAARYMTRLAEAMKVRGTQMVFLSVPPRGIAGQAFFDDTQPAQSNYAVKEVETSYQEMLAKLRATGMLVPDLMKLSTDAPDTKTPFFFKRDHHWTPFGARQAAEAIAAALKDDPAYKALKPATYQTTETGKLEMRHTMANEIQRLCSSQIPSEPYPEFETRLQAAAGSGEDALFGDSAGADPTVLVGSSFSAQANFNFDGFLSEATGMEIANYALSAGLLFNAIVSYTASPDFAGANPPFLIWEAPGIYDLNQNSTPFFRQILPAIAGDCGPEKAIASGTLDVKKGEGGLLFPLDPAQKISGSHYYIYVESSNRGLAKFTLQLDYDDGDGEWFQVDRSEHFNNTGRFFVELDDEISSNLKEVHIQQLSNVNTSLTARLCTTSTPTKPK